MPGGGCCVDSIDGGKAKEADDTPPQPFPLLPIGPSDTEGKGPDGEMPVDLASAIAPRKRSRLFN